MSEIDIAWLSSHNLEFPPVSKALRDPNGLLAVGGDLRPERLLRAYASGIFPWYEQGQPILWWSPDPRMCLAPEAVQVSHSLRKLLRQQRFQLSMDRSFDEVIRQCAETRLPGPGTWISPEMQQAYGELHRLGHAHSVEVWHENKLVGGLYGIAMGRVFFGESMFSLQSNASKVAFVALCRQLQAWDYRLIDCQMPTEHLARLGARPMARQDYLQVLASNSSDSSDNRAGPWSMDTGCLA